MCHKLFGCGSLSVTFPTPLMMRGGISFLGAHLVLASQVNQMTVKLQSKPGILL